MAPKPAKPGSAKKKPDPKKQKEEEEKRKQEEEERKRLEEEEKERQEKLRLEQEKEEQRLAAEKQRLSDQEVSFLQENEKRELFLYNRKITVTSIDEWEDFLICAKVPDVTNVAEMNSYFSSWKNFETDGTVEEINQAKRFQNKRDVNLYYSDLDLAIELCSRIQIAYMNARLDMNAELATFHLTNIKRLCESILDTLDDVTAYLMQFNDEYFNHTSAGQYTKQLQNLKLAIWMNLAMNGRMRQVDFEEINSSVELALKGMNMMKIGIRYCSMNTDILSLTAPKRPVITPVGPIYFIDIIDLPPKTSAKREWKVRPIAEVSYTVKRKPYVQLDFQGNEAEAPPTRVVLVLQPNFLIRKALPEVAWWDSQEKYWNMNGISDIRHDTETGKVQFDTTHLTTALAFVHNRIHDIPFESWYIAPLQEAGKSCAVFNIVPKQYSDAPNISHITILIMEHKCKLIHPQIPQLKDLNTQFHLPRELLFKMAAAGINLMIEDTDIEQSNIPFTPKSSELETKIYNDLSLICSVKVIASSKWNNNASVSKDEAVLRISKKFYDPRTLVYTKNMAVDFDNISMTTELDVNNEEHWDTVLCTRKMSYFIVDKESSETLEKRRMEERDTHLSIYHCLQEVLDSNDEMSGESIVRAMVDSSDMLVCESMKQLLSAIRPLSWC